MKTKNKKLTLLLASILFLLCFMITTGDNMVRAEETNPSANDITLNYGMLGSYFELDPLRAYDRASMRVIDQTVERLFQYNLSDVNLGIIPGLASSMGIWSTDNLNYTVSLRSGVEFHDGPPFDADAVKWNFDRLAYFMNIEGTLPPETPITTLNHLYRWADGTPIINKTIVVNPLKIKFVLNRPYAAFESLLCFSGSGMLSPTSTPQTEYLESSTSHLVGTGPFVYDEHIQDEKIEFHAFKNYSAGSGNIDNLTFKIFENINELTQALSSGEIEFIADVPNNMIENFTADPKIIVESGKSTTFFNFIMNNNHINKTMRQAISYAINYSYIINELCNGHAARLTSAIPEGILYSNTSFDYPTMNVTEARRRLVDAGICDLDIENDAEWEAVTINNPIATYNFSYPTYSNQEYFGTLLEDNLAKIGIQVYSVQLDFSEWFQRLFDSDPYSRDMLQLYWIGWGPDFNDPVNIIDQLYSTDSENNFANTNDPYLENLITEASQETNPTLRENLYDTIQQYLVEDLMPFAYLYVPLNYIAYNSNYTGFEWNPLGIVRFRYVMRKITLETPKGTNVEITDGYHDLNMTYGEITDNGTTTITSTTKGVDPQTGFGLAGDYYNITTTAEYSGTITLSFAYDEDEIECDETELQLMHWDDDLGEWIDVTTFIDTENNIIYGETSSLSTFSIFQPDITPPTTKLVKKGSLGVDNWYSSDVYVILSAKDTLSKIDKIEYSFDNTEWYEYSDLFSITEEGETTIYFKSTDSAGNVEFAKSEIIKIDKTLPESTINLSGNEGGDGWFISDVSIELDSVDVLSGEYLIEYSLDEAEWQQYTAPLTVSSDGYHMLEYKSIDKAGNIESVKSVEFKIDQTAPETTIIIDGTPGLEEWYISQVNVSFSTLDTNSGTAYIEYSYNGVDWYTYLDKINIASEGFTSLYFKSTDIAGNTEEVQLETISIDYSLPDTELIISPVSNQSDTIYVAYESSFVLIGLDEYSGTAYTFYRINGSEWLEYQKPFNLTGELGEYIIEYYSIDAAGNIEEIQSTVVLLVESFGEEFEGFGILRLNGQRLIGYATLTVTEDMIDMEIDDQTASWDVVDYSEFGNVEFYYGENESGHILVIIIRFEDKVCTMAVGSGVYFISYS